MSDPSPPPLPKYASPDVVGKTWVLSDDGARWRYMGDHWDLVDPPGTHSAEVDRGKSVTRLMDAGLRLGRSRVDDEFVVNALVALGCDRPDLMREASAPWRDHGASYPSGRASRLLVRAADIAEGRPQQDVSPLFDVAAYHLALCRVIDDVDATTSIRPEVTLDLTDDAGLPYRYRAASGDSTRSSALTGAKDEEEATLELAWEVQLDVEADLWAGWPECPGHEHPMVPRLVGGAASWVCPAGGGERLEVIGYLPTP